LTRGVSGGVGVGWDLQDGIGLALITNCKRLLLPWNGFGARVRDQQRREMNSDARSAQPPTKHVLRHSRPIIRLQAKLSYLLNSFLSSKLCFTRPMCWGRAGLVLVSLSWAFSPWAWLHWRRHDLLSILPVR
jgi:hypothetical protein